MRRLLAVGLGLSFLFITTTTSMAASMDTYIKDAGLQVSTQQPQASAEALLRLPSVYILPGSFFYWCKQIAESIHLLFVTKPEDRASLLLDMSNQRLAEGYQAMKNGQWQAAATSLQNFQQEQQSLSDSLGGMDLQQSQWKQLLDRLQKQLQLQQSLHTFARTQSQAGLNQQNKQVAHEVGMMLGNSPFDHLAYVSYPNQAVLGVADVEQATASAQATTSAQASMSATLSGQLKEAQ
jgi:hypothetical protein